MSEEPPTIEQLEGLEGEKRIGKLKQLLEAGIDPTTIKKKDDEKPDPKTPPKTTELTEADKIYTQENFDKLIKGYENLDNTMKKDKVDLQRGVILEEIKVLDEPSFEVEKDNYSINELNKVLSNLKRTKGSEHNERDVGGFPNDKDTKAPNTQYDSVLKKFVPG